MDYSDHSVRIAAFDWLKEQVAVHGDVLPSSLLAKGFVFDNRRIPLVAPQGIFKPQVCRYPLSIATTPNSPYDDKSNAGFLSYKYRGTDPYHRDNVGLRQAFQNQIPLIYFFGLRAGLYEAYWPVYVARDDPADLTFQIDLSTARINTEEELAEADPGVKAYITSEVKLRLHQRRFRELVLHAYRRRCSICRIKHIELLDAAHIIPDNEKQSVSTVDNGISLCKIHHAAYDSMILGISPDYKVEIREDVLKEKDGHMLQYGLKQLHQSKIHLPGSKTKWPKREYLDWRYSRFRKAG
jgi:putative restriction endonuclease